MKESYLKYYEQYAAMAPCRIFWDALFTRSKVAKISLMNRLKDYAALSNDPNLLRLHKTLNMELLEATRKWNSYDYGEGYFYQGCEEIHVTGLRNTTARIGFMDLKTRLNSKRVLEIGCNSGFLAISVAEYCSQICGFDVNTHLITIGNAVVEHLNKKNCRLQTASFEDFQSKDHFDTILSFANHSTYDQNTKQSIKDYFQRCHALLEPHGELLFESHPPEYEGEGLNDVIDVIKQFFSIVETKINNTGTYLDKGRTFIVAKKQ